MNALAQATRADIEGDLLSLTISQIIGERAKAEAEIARLVGQLAYAQATHAIAGRILAACTTIDDVRAYQPQEVR